MSWWNVPLSEHRISQNSQQSVTCEAFFPCPPEASALRLSQSPWGRKMSLTWREVPHSDPEGFIRGDKSSHQSAFVADKELGDVTFAGFPPRCTCAQLDDRPERQRLVLSARHVRTLSPHYRHQWRVLSLLCQPDISGH